jgi:hypothetical protein
MPSDDLPPWMRPQGSGVPPPSPTVPPPRMYEAEPPRPTGLLTFVAVVNLVFSLGCGCLGTLYTSSVLALTQPGFADAGVDRETVREAMENQFLQTLRNPALRRGTEREISEEDMQRLAKGGSHAMLAAAEDAHGSPSVRHIRNAAVAGSLSHVVLFIGSVLLLMRRPFGWWASVVACAAYMGAVAATIWFTEGATGAYLEAFASVLQDQTRVPELTTAERDLLGQKALDLHQALSPIAAVGGVASALWPMVALLILLFSQSIRGALRSAASLRTFE